MSDQGCVFCDIVAGRSPASTVYEDEELLAFLDIRPVTIGHLLVVPKRHSVGLADLAEDTGAGMWRRA
jgi:histidine triad (HIT) family protein